MSTRDTVKLTHHLYNHTDENK